MEHMQVLGEATALDNVEENCILKCCELGPEDCQYVWIIWSRCYAVSCTENPSDCQPMQVPHLTQFETIYFQISWSEHRPQQHSGREGVGGHRGSVDVNPSLDVLDVSEGGTSSSGPSGADSAPPVANAGPDVIITYPEETTVTLNGSLSTDDKVWLFLSFPCSSSCIPSCNLANVAWQKYPHLYGNCDLSMYRASLLICGN